MLETECDEQDLEHNRANYYKIVADVLFLLSFFFRKNEMFPV